MNLDVVRQAMSSLVADLGKLCEGLYRMKMPHFDLGFLSEKKKKETLELR